MCFSASASFTAGAVLSVIGVATIKKSTTRSQLAFATIPMIFAVQQICEGFLWLALENPAFLSLQATMTYLFLFFAQVVWPLWVPLAIYLLEENPKRKKVQKGLLGMGVMVSAYLAYCLVSYPVLGKVLGYHISYEQDYPEALSLYGGGFYVIATILPPFLSSVKKMWMLGSLILISYIITTIFYEDYIVSVWCFFASVISICVLFVMYEIQKMGRPYFTNDSGVATN